MQIGPTLRESAPCCSTRPDVADEFPDQTNAELSGWGLVFNYGRLPEGTQPVTAQITTTAGLTHTETHTAVVARLGGYEFVNRFDLSAATVEIVGEDIILSGVEVRDSATQATQTIEVRLRWSRATQGVGDCRYGGDAIVPLLHWECGQLARLRAGSPHSRDAGSPALQSPRIRGIRQQKNPLSGGVPR